MEGQAHSVEEWIALAHRHRGDAYAARKSKRYSACCTSTGLSIECLVKAAIVKKFRWNRFPSKQERPSLYSHDIGLLIQQLDVDLRHINQAFGPKIATMTALVRNARYDPKPMPERFVSDIFDAAFGRYGVMEWLTKTFHLS